MGQAWTHATAMLGANRELVIIIAGLFLFLPQFALAVFVPEAMNPAPPPAGDPSDVQAVIDASMGAMTAQYSKYGWLFLGITLFQTLGTLALLTLLTDTSRPTVGEAIKLGARGLLPYIGAAIIMALGAAVVIGVPIGLLSTLGGPAVAIAVLIAFPLIIYIAIKFSLYTAVIAIEREYNPINALKRSWQLTKGNSFRLLLFLFLLFLALGVVSLVLTLVTGTIFAALGGTIEQIGNGFIAALMSAVLGAVFLAVFAAIHAQLSGEQADKNVQDVFE